MIPHKAALWAIYKRNLKELPSPNLAGRPVPVVKLTGHGGRNVAEWHTVRQGECFTVIAKHYGFLDYRTIYDHPQNQPLKNKRPNPHVLYPGDQVYIPDKKPKVENRATGQVHRFKIAKPRAELKIVIKDADGKPVPDTPYKLMVEGLLLEGTTNEEGLLAQEIPIGAQTGTLELPERNRRWDVRIGHLDPVQDEDTGAPIVSGAQARLNNLGYFCGKVDGIEGPKTTAAVKRFQTEVLGRQDPDGQLDKDTRDALRREHCC